MWKETSPVLSVAFAREILLSIACTSQNLNRFLFPDTSRYTLYVTGSGKFLCNFYVIRMYGHLLPLMNSHLKQCRSFSKKEKKKLISVRFLNVQVSSLFLSIAQNQFDIAPYWNYLLPSVSLKLERLRHWNILESFIFVYEWKLSINANRPNLIYNYKKF
jgi:hypothetical protein